MRIIKLLTICLCCVFFLISVNGCGSSKVDLSQDLSEEEVQALDERMRAFGEMQERTAQEGAAGAQEATAY